MHTVPKGLGSVKDLIKRFGKAKQRREMWRSLFQEAYEYALPQKETFNFHSPGQSKNRHLYDSTAVIGVRTYAARIQFSHTPPWQNWMDFVAGSDVPKDAQEKTNKDLELMTEIFFAHLNESDYSNQSNEADQDLAISTGAMFFEQGNVLEGEPLFKFTAIPLAQLYLEPGEGVRQTGWREHKVVARDIEGMFPGADLGEALTKVVQNKPDEKVTILNGVLKAHGVFHQVVIYEKEDHLMFVQMFNTSPLIIWRTNVIPGETYGRGPVLDVLADIRTVNKVKEFMLKNAAIQMSGVYTAVGGSGFNPHTATISPGAMLAVDSNDSRNPTVKALELSGRMELGELIIGDLQGNINKALFSNPLGEVTDPVKSATEQMLRTQEMLRTSGAQFTRLNSEKIKPIVERAVDILSTEGLIAPLKVDGKEVKVKMQSPLAKAEELEEFSNFQVWWNQMLQLPPEVLALGAKVENIPTWTASKLGLPITELVRTKDEIKAAQAKVLQLAEEVGLDGGATGDSGH